MNEVHPGLGFLDLVFRDSPLTLGGSLFFSPVTAGGYIQAFLTLAQSHNGGTK